jgi:hypothetical protein
MLLKGRRAIRLMLPYPLAPPLRPQRCYPPPAWPPCDCHHSTPLHRQFAVLQDVARDVEVEGIEKVLLERTGSLAQAASRRRARSLHDAAIPHPAPRA